MAHLKDLPDGSYPAVIEQYLKVARQHLNKIILFRIGDFYEAFFDDALLLSERYGYALTQYQNDKRCPMCGVPSGAIDEHVARITCDGYSVVICEQGTGSVGGILERYVDGIITPGTVTDMTLLDGSRRNALCCCYADTDARIIGVAHVDVTLGEITVSCAAYTDLLPALVGEVSRIEPAELLLSDALYNDNVIRDTLHERITPAIARIDALPYSIAVDLLSRRFNDSIAVEALLDGDEAALFAAAALLSYIDGVKGDASRLIRRLNFVYSTSRLIMDYATVRHLELLRNARSGKPSGSLYSLLGRTVTPMGARLFRQWLTEPLCNLSEISARQESVAQLIFMRRVMSSVTEALRDVRDLHRMATRFLTRKAGASDCVALLPMLSPVGILKQALSPVTEPLLCGIRDDMDPCDDLCIMLRHTFGDAPEGYLLREGYSDEADRLRRLIAHTSETIERLESDKRAQIGVRTLRIKQNRILGYFYEIPLSQVANAKLPDDFAKRQESGNNARYQDPELKSLEAALGSATERLSAIEAAAVDYAIDCINEANERLIRTADALSRLDCLVALADCAVHYGFTKPVLRDNGMIYIEGGYHPVVRELLRDAFVPNDAVFTSDDYVKLLTGPNMSGKSTYMKTVAVILIMAQMGGYVPASYAELSPVDHIFTRAGSADYLTEGESTFMVEMREVAYILNNATQKSLILLDEIGRGTSTADGIAIAQAVIEHIAQQVQCKTICSTHFHQLTSLSEYVSCLRNYCINIIRDGEHIAFSHKVTTGIADRSYGIETARLAQLPDTVLRRAKALHEAYE